MKNIILTLTLFILSITLVFSKTIYGTFIFDKQLVAYEFTQVDPTKNYYSLKFKKIKAAEGSVENSEERLLENLTDIQLDIYQKAIFELLGPLFPESLYITDPDQYNNKKYRDALSTRLFYELKNRMEFEDNRPQTGIMYLLSEEIIVYGGPKFKFTDSKKERNTVLDTIKYSVKKVEIQFADGGINNVLVETQNKDETDLNKVTKFRNNMPISISSKFDPEGFLDHKIYHDGATGDLADTLSWYIKLNELIRYDIVLENNKEDYSPKDTIITLTPSAFSVEVFKDNSSKILSARTYTDLVGMDDQQPNGLVQIEVFKRFNFITSRTQSTRTIYYGLFTYIQPMFSLTKIEENNRYLSINNFPNIENSFTVNPIELLKYQQFNFGIDLNFLNYNFPHVKSKVFVDIHYDIGRTTLSYEESETSNILTRLNYSTYGPTFYYQILPDSRFGFKTGYDIRNQSVHAKKVSLPSDKQVDLINSDLKWYGTYWFLGYLKTNPNSELFFRLRYHHRFKESESNYLQVQLGASFDIVRNR